MSVTLSPRQPRAYNVLIYFHHGNHSSFNIFTYSVIIQPNLDAMLMLNVAAACNFWPLAAKASRLSFTNNLVDEATAAEEFPGFHDNAGLMLIFFLQQLHRPGRRIMIIQAWQRPDLSEERSSPRLHLRENSGPLLKPS